MIASAPPEHYRRTIETVLKSGEVDALIVIYIPVGLAETAAVAAAVREGGRGPSRSGTRQARARLLDGGRRRARKLPWRKKIPSYVFPEAAARVLSKAVTYAEWRAQPIGMVPEFDDLDLPLARTICKAALDQRGNGWLNAEETRVALGALRLPLAAGGVARSADEAVELARRVGFPVAVKLASHQLVHKTEVGGVHLNLADADAVRRAFAAIRDRLEADNNLAAMEGVVVQPMLTGCVEVMIGMTEDPQFGPLIAFGLGGIHVEILGDVCFRVAPLTDRDAHEMVRSIRGFRLLQGYRGHPPADVDALQEVLLRTSRLVEEVPEISELDMNPVFALRPGKAAYRRCPDRSPPVNLSRIPLGPLPVPNRTAVRGLDLPSVSTRQSAVKATFSGGTKFAINLLARANGFREPFMPTLSHVATRYLP